MTDKQPKKKVVLQGFGPKPVGSGAQRAAESSAEPTERPKSFRLDGFTTERPAEPQLDQASNSDPGPLDREQPGRPVDEVRSRPTVGVGHGADNTPVGDPSGRAGRDLPAGGRATETVRQQADHRRDKFYPVDADPVRVKRRKALKKRIRGLASST